MQNYGSLLLGALAFVGAIGFLTSHLWQKQRRRWGSFGGYRPEPSGIAPEKHPPNFGPYREPALSTLRGAPADPARELVLDLRAELSFLATWLAAGAGYSVPEKTTQAMADRAKQAAARAAAYLGEK